VQTIYRDLMTLKTELQRERQKSHQLELKVLDLEERSFNAPEDLAKAKWRISNRMLVEYTPKFKSMLGYSKERLDNFSCHDLFPPYVIIKKARPGFFLSLQLFFLGCFSALVATCFS